MKAVLFRAIRNGFIGLIAGPAIVLCLMLPIVYFDRKCGVGDSGGCAMGVASAMVLSVLPSAAIAFIFTLLHGAWRLDKDKPLD